MRSALLCAELSTLEDTVGIGSEVSLFEITDLFRLVQKSSKDEVDFDLFPDLEASALLA